MQFHIYWNRASGRALNKKLLYTYVPRNVILLHLFTALLRNNSFVVAAIYSEE